MAKPSNKYHHGDLFQTVLNHAFAVVRAEGQQRLSLRACAVAAGVNPAAVYRHFAGKDDLLDHVRARGFSLLANSMEGALVDVEASNAAALPWNDIFTALGVVYVTFSQREPQLFTAMFTGQRLADSLRALASSDAGRTPLDIQRAMISRYLSVDSSESPTPAVVDRTVEVYWSAIHGMATLLNTGHLHGDHLTVEDRVRHLVEILL